MLHQVFPSLEINCIKSGQKLIDALNILWLSDHRPSQSSEHPNCINHTLLMPNFNNISQNM